MILALAAYTSAALLQVQYVFWLQSVSKKYLDDTYIINYCLVLLKVMSSFEDRKPAEIQRLNTVAVKNPY